MARELFRISEKQLLEFLEYVPPKEKHLCVESPVIYHLMMSSGPQVEPMMAKLVELIEPEKYERLVIEARKVAEDRKFPNPQKARPGFSKCYDAIQGKVKLESQKVITKKERLPFQPFTDRYPVWWEAYSSSIKHNPLEELEKAKLENLLNMHAALFILHYMVGLRTRELLFNPRSHSIFSSRDNWIELDDCSGKVRPRAPFKLRTLALFTGDNPAAGRKIMAQAAGMESGVFDYCTVVDPFLLTGYQPDSLGLAHY